MNRITKLTFAHMMGGRTCLALATAVLVLGQAGGAPAQEGPDDPIGVVELFTSQGCSSCPPADEVLGELARSGETVALAYHVDYWDYMGWQDTFASPDNTARQRDYARTFDGSFYTPQAVINGRTHLPGSRRDALDRRLERMADTADGLTVDVSVSESGDSVIIETGAGRRVTPEAHVVLVYFLPPQNVKVRSGENSGRMLEYWNVVTDIQTVGMWHGNAKRFEIPKSEIARKGGGCAVLLQSVTGSGRPGAILGAAVMNAPRS